MVLGFFLLSLAIGALQMMLDRGQSQDWLQSGEVLFELVLTVGAFYLFVCHMFTSKAPYIDPGVFRDRNFNLGLIFIFIVGIILLATMALLPPFLQNLMGYPVVDVGLILAPRGLGTMMAMVVVGRLSGRVDPRYMLFFGMLLTAFSMWEMTQFTTDVSRGAIIGTGLVQGFGLGFIFVPLTTISFSTLAPRYRNEATALYSLIRNIGSSIGISVVMAYLAQRTQINHAAFASYMTPYNQALDNAVGQGVLDVSTPAGLAMLDQAVTAQASTLAFLQDFRLMMWVVLAAIPLLLLLRPVTPTTAE